MKKTHIFFVLVPIAISICGSIATANISAVAGWSVALLWAFVAVTRDQAC